MLSKGFSLTTDNVKTSKNVKKQVAMDKVTCAG